MQDICFQLLHDILCYISKEKVKLKVCNDKCKLVPSNYKKHKQDLYRIFEKQNFYAFTKMYLITLIPNPSPYHSTPLQWDFCHKLLVIQIHKSTNVYYTLSKLSSQLNKMHS